MTKITGWSNAMAIYHEWSHNINYYELTELTLREYVDLDTYRSQTKRAINRARRTQQEYWWNIPSNWYVGWIEAA